MKASLENKNAEQKIEENPRAHHDWEQTDLEFRRIATCQFFLASRMFLEEELNLGCWGPANLTRAKFSRQNRPLREASPVFK